MGIISDEVMPNIFLFLSENNWIFTIIIEINSVYLQ